MCDTIVALPNSSADNVLLFGKNSDRQRNEAQFLDIIPAADHSAGDTVRCTYVTVPQVSHTYRMLLSRPYWIWGAEMGANEHGVVIGNEGLFSVVPASETPALVGMDLIRLALERSSTAREAISVITELVERHGQGGNCGHLSPDYYHNGFLIADAAEAFVLETVARDWSWERVADVRAISNCYSIARPDALSDGMRERLRAITPAEDSPLACDRLANREREHVGEARERQSRAATMLTEANGRLRVADMFAILRDHRQNTPPGWHPSIAPARGVCVHAGGADRRGQTTGAMVSRIGNGRTVHWVTATAAPCISIFKPLLLDGAPPNMGAQPNGYFDIETVWWRHELFHRAALAGDFGLLLKDIAPERDALEASFISRIEEASMGDFRSLDGIVRQCWEEAAVLELKWVAQVQTAARPAGTDDCHATWQLMSEIARVPESL